MVLLQFSSNFAQGPFQGYLPDLVPAAQVGFASALVGVMSILGVIGGTLVASAGYGLGSFVIPTIALGLDRAGDGDRHGHLGARGASPEGPRRPVMVGHRGARRGASTCCASAASCGWSDRACSSSRESRC